ITTLAAHTFALCTELRVLDLSQNPIESLPYKPFFRNSKLKWIKLSGTKIARLGPEHFAGLGALKSLTLSYNPLDSIDPFAFLPLKSLKTLDLEATNITAIPSAVIQNCGLTQYVANF
ncbi:leucine Rich repeat-containing domain protein, partial [Ancylostoma duodenale]